MGDTDPPGTAAADLRAANVRWWDALAPAWAARPERPERAVDDLVAQLGCPPGGLLLDAGCGTGAYSLPLARRGYRVRGVDVAPGQIAQARRRAEAQGLGAAQARFDVGDLERLPLPDGAVDGVLCWLVLDFVPRPGVVLAEFRRVLRPGGRLVLAVLGAHSAVRFDPGHERWRRFLPEPPPVIPLNDILPWEVEALLCALGWALVAQRPLVGRSLRGPDRPDTEALVGTLPDRVLQQTVADWVFVAAKP